MIPANRLFSDSELSSESVEVDLYLHFGAVAEDLMRRFDAGGPPSFVEISSEAVRVLEIVTGDAGLDETWVDEVLSAATAGTEHLVFAKVARALGVDPADYKAFGDMIETRLEESATIPAPEVLRQLRDPNAWWNEPGRRDRDPS